MNVKLRKMSSQEFEIFAQYSTEDYAKDLLKESEYSWDKALMQAKKEFDEMLPDGPETKNNAIMIIEDDITGDSVGVIWYLYEMTDGVKHTFINDFIIKTEERRKGYAIAALEEMEHDAKRHGYEECRLYVWKHNLAGKRLYEKAGYQEFRQADDGVYMKKVVKA